ncbi:MAG: hypothetical protein H6741_31025 [Alphaproteobacteria bacterium]|nr:hypothetical protein [Alphaproteobacteria bacterium]
MSRPVRHDDAAAALRELITERVRALAGDVEWLSNDQAATLQRHLVNSERALRVTGGADVAVRVEALIERSVASALEVWERHNPQDVPRDRVWLALDELRAIERDDAAVGELSRAAHDRVRASQSDDPAASVRAWFDAYDFNGRSLGANSLPDGRRVDAREGQPEREGVPAAVLEAFDYYYRVEAADWGSASLHRGSAGGVEVWVVYLSTDGDAAWLEVLDVDGGDLAGARLFGGQIVSWDRFPKRLRLSKALTTVGGVEWEEGYSEPDTREEFGQPPRSWTGELVVDRGDLYAGEHQQLDRVDLHDLSLTAEQRALAVAAFDYLWDVHLRHRQWGSEPVDIGPRSNGVLTLGDFYKHPRGRSYATAWWRDIDDGSFVLYFDRDPRYGLQLAISQFDN